MSSDTLVGSVGECWRYPVKSFQGASVRRVHVGPRGVTGDRDFALLDTESGIVLSAKRVSALLGARSSDTALHLPDGTEVRLDAVELDAVLSAWLGREVRLVGAGSTGQVSYEMTFDPPDDGAEYVEIPMPEDSFVDLAPLHLLATATLDGCRLSRPDLDWDVRRFRPNLLVDGPGGTFVEDGWVGHRLGVGPQCVLRVLSPTVRCAMPLRSQPAGLDGEPELPRQPELFAAMEELHDASPNHLGVYAEVVEPGTVSVGDDVVLLVHD